MYTLVLKKGVEDKKMKLHGLTFLYENIDVVAIVIILCVVFFIFWDRQTTIQDEEQIDRTKMKWYDVSRIDIVSNKMSVSLGILLFAIYIAVS